MKDRQNAIDVVSTFLHDEFKKIILIKGYDNEAKLKVALTCLNKVYSKGIIRTSAMFDISDHINRAFNKDILPEYVKSTITYKLGKMKVIISSYVTHTISNPKGNDETFTVFYPVQTVLDDSKRYNKFLRELKKTESSKIILITTNEWGIKRWDIENQVDEIFFYSVENDNPKIMSNLRANGAIT